MARLLAPRLAADRCGEGLLVGQKRGIDLIWVTAPHVRNLVTGYFLSRALRKPLIVDLRDPWTYGSLWQPPTPLLERLERRYAHRILSHAARVIVTSPLTQKEMEDRFEVLDGKCLTITNGYSAEEEQAPERGGHEGKLLLRYSGLLNQRRKPDVLLAGLRRAIEQQPTLRETVHLEFVGDMAGHEPKFAEYGLSDCVSSRGRVSRQRSLALMRGADINVLLQTITTGTDVIAGKTYDYLAAKRPIFGVVDPNGGDAWLLNQLSGTAVVSFEDVGKIASTICDYHAQWERGDLQSLSPDIGAFERRALTRCLATECDRVLADL